MISLNPSPLLLFSRVKKQQPFLFPLFFYCFFNHSMASVTTIQLYRSFFFLLFFFFFSAAVLHSAASATQQGPISHRYHVLPSNDAKNPTMAQHKLQLFKEEDGNIMKGRSYGRRVLIGSMAPICTYNECRGCKLYTKKCWAEQVPVEGNDPINSAYHYKCVCHR